MTTARPDLWPLHDLLETNVVAPEDSLYLQSGYPSGLAVPSDDHNGKMNRAGLWAKHLDLNGVRNSDWFDTAAAAVLSPSTLTYLAGGNVLTTGAVVDTRGVFLVNGTRIETDTAFLNQVGATVQGDPLIYPSATVPGRIWVYASEDGTPRFESVGPAVNDVPGVGEITLNGLQIDALGVVTDGAVAPVTLPLPDPLIPIARRVSIVFDSPDPALLVDNLSGLGLSITSGGADIAGDVAVTGATTVTGTFTVAADNPAILTGNVTLGDTSADAIVVNGQTSFNAAVTVVNGVTFTANGNVVIGNADTDTLTCTATATFNNGVTLGSSSLDSLTINATINAPVTLGVTSASPALTVANAGTGRAISAVAASGYAGHFTTDTSSPTTAPIHIVPQDADPSVPVQGDIINNLTRNKMRFRALTDWQSIHSSPNGHIFEFAMDLTFLGLAGSTGEICRCTVTPEVVGLVLLTVSFVWDPAADNTTVGVTLRDDTVPVNIVTHNIRAKDVDASGTRGETVSFQYAYTLPSAATRDFVVIIQTSASADVYDPTLRVDGVK